MSNPERTCKLLAQAFEESPTPGTMYGHGVFELVFEVEEEKAPPAG